MNHAYMLGDFPFTFTTEMKHTDTRCSFLVSRDLHESGLWKFECCCGFNASCDNPCVNDGWSLTNTSCPCTDPRTPLSTSLGNWKEYYHWRCLPLHSPVAILLHWPLTIYHCFQLSYSCVMEVSENVVIHYLGPDKELLQLAIFRELGALFPGVNLKIEFFGPAVPEFRDGDEITLCNYPCCAEKECICKTSIGTADFGVPLSKTSAVTLKFHKGFYHECYNYEVCFPHIIIAPNAGIAAYPSWLPTIKLIKEMGVPAVFTDFCEEAANLASHCIETVNETSLRLPVQVNPFRQPLPVEDSALFLPCYSNCFLFGM